MRNLTFIFIGFLLFGSCSDGSALEKDKVNDKSEQVEESTIPQQPILEDQNPESASSSSGKSNLKNGEIKSYFNGKVSKVEHFVNGIRHGKSQSYYANGDIYESFYENGVRQKYSMEYTPGHTSAKFLIFWKDDEKVWGTFPSQIEHYFVPVKGFINSSNAEIEVVIPYISGKTLAIGRISESGKPIGKHRIYYESQELKAIVDYEADSIKIFNLKGKIIENRGLTGMELVP